MPNGQTPQRPSQQPRPAAAGPSPQKTVPRKSAPGQQENKPSFAGQETASQDVQRPEPAEETASLRDQFFELFGERNFQMVDLPDGPRYDEMEGLLYVRTLSLEESVSLEIMRPNQDIDGEIGSDLFEKKWARYMASFVATAVCDSNGDAIFTSSDAERLFALPDAALMTTLYRQASNVSKTYGDAPGDGEATVEEGNG